MNSSHARKRTLSVEAESLREIELNEIEQLYWTPFALTTTALVFMLAYTFAMFIAITGFSQTLTPVRKGAVVDLTTKVSPSVCSYSIDDIFDRIHVDAKCPENSNFNFWGAYCCCSTCSQEQAPYLFYEWSELPALPRFSEPSGHYIDAFQFTVSSTWFLISFGPNIAVVIYSVLWNTIDITLKKLHPFMEMSRGGHTDTGSKICFTYLDKISLMVPYYSYRNRDRLVFIVSLLDVTASIVLVPLIIGCFELQVFGVLADGGTTFGRSPAVKHSFVYSAAVVLGFLMVGTLYLLWILRKQTSSVYSDPSSMASIFGMAHPSVLREIRAIDSEVGSGRLSSTKLYKRLRMLEPRLAHVIDVAGSTKYQIIINTPPEQSTQPPIKDCSSEWLQKFRGSTTINILLLFVVTGAFGTAYNFKIHPVGASNTPMEAFWSKEGVTALAVLMKICWTTTERETRLLEPLRRLASRGAKNYGRSAARTILPPLESNPLTAMYHFARRRSACLFLFASAVFATEVLTMIIGPGLGSSNLVYTDSDGTVWTIGFDMPSYVLRIIHFTGLGIVGLAIFVMAGYRATSLKIPDGYGIRTVADTLRLVCGSQCVEDFAQVSMLEQKERNKTVLGWKERYSVGVVRDVDGVKRWGVDFRRFILRDQTLEDMS